jgi:hypothetical protein
VALEIEVGDDFGIEQRDRVARRRVAIARMEFLRDGRAAHDVAPLDDAHLQSRRREIIGTDEAVMAGADDEDVHRLRHRAADRADGRAGCKWSRALPVQTRMYATSTLPFMAFE